MTAQLATGPVVLLSVPDAEATARNVRVLGHFLRVMSELATDKPGGRIDMCAESFSVVMEELAGRCMACEAEIAGLGADPGNRP